jgi:hypothetical protein
MAIYSEFPIKNGDFPWLSKRLPEGNHHVSHSMAIEWGYQFQTNQTSSTNWWLYTHLMLKNSR